MTKETKEILDKIDGLIEWWETYSCTAALPDLLNTQDELASYSWRLAEISSETKTDYTYKYLMRKIQVNKKAQALVKSGVEKAWTKAIARSEVENEAVLKAEIEAEGAAYMADIKLKQVNKILGIMQQRISFVKMQYGLNQYIDGE